MAVVKRKDAVLSPLFEVVEGGYRYKRPAWMDDDGPGVVWSADTERYVRRFAHVQAAKAGLTGAALDDFVQSAAVGAYVKVRDGKIRMKAGLGWHVKNSLKDAIRRNKCRDHQPLDGVIESETDRRAEAQVDDLLSAIGLDAMEIPEGLKTYARLQMEGHSDAECAEAMGFAGLSELKSALAGWRLTLHGQGSLCD